MEPFTLVRGPAAPLMLPDVDTDIISPAHGGGADPARSAFGPLRYLPDGSDNPAFVLNRPAFRDAPILLAARNFGCGSSRESAVWALQAIGIRCVVAPSFGDIFAGNCFQNGVLPIVLRPDVVERLAVECETGAPIEVNLETQMITGAGGDVTSFMVDPTRRRQLLAGLDDLDVGLLRRDRVRAFQDDDRRRRPWIYAFGPDGTA